MELVRRDMENIDRIVRENVERAVRGREKQIQEMGERYRELQEKNAKVEAHKECFAKSIKSLEA